MKKTIAIIPARGGSQRLPKKNILSLDGIPLLAHSIVFAKSHPHLLDGVWVSTDDLEIKEIALAYGASVLDRPVALATHTTPTIAVLQDALVQLGDSIDTIVLLQPTNPLRPKNLLEETLAQYKLKGADSLMTVTRNHQKFGKIIDGQFVPFNYELGQRSQDLEPLYFENGLLYISKASVIKKGAILGKKNIPFIVDHLFATIDIDTQEDLAYANYILTHCKEA
ncbi:MAG: acylneuraminate cytidylyltransferase family protein [Flavobacteriaceae bacterium]